MEVDTTTGRLEMRYPLIIEHGEQNFSAYVPDLPKSAAVLQPYDVSRRWLVVKRRIAPSGATHTTPLSIQA
jgi:hypothetical protein